MCTRPVYIRDGGFVACRQCRQCRFDRVNSWVGKAIAESKTSRHCLSVTLTYSNDPKNGVAMKVLHYADIQKFLKRIRQWYPDNDKLGNVRFMVAGEYGDKTARAHWHIMLFFSGQMPPLPPEGKRAAWQFWPHGHVFSQPAGEGGIRYMCKYLLKGKKNGAEVRKLQMSKIPPLGTEWQLKRAYEMARDGLAFHDWAYQFPDSLRPDGSARQYWLEGISRDFFARTYIATHWATHGCAPPQTDSLTAIEDKWAREDKKHAQMLWEWRHGSPTLITRAVPTKKGCIYKTESGRITYLHWWEDERWLAELVYVEEMIAAGRGTLTRPSIPARDRRLQAVARLIKRAQEAQESTRGILRKVLAFRPIKTATPTGDRLPLRNATHHHEHVQVFRDQSLDVTAWHRLGRRNAVDYKAQMRNRK